MDKTVTVEITITERVTYSRRVKMGFEKFKELETNLENFHGRELRRVEEQIGDFLDRQSDWQDADNLEIQDFRIVTR